MQIERHGAGKRRDAVAAPPSPGSSPRATNPSIPGTKRVARLEENVGAAAIKLDAADLARIDAAMPPGSAAGSRYPEPMMKGVHI